MQQISPILHMLAELYVAPMGGRTAGPAEDSVLNAQIAADALSTVSPAPTGSAGAGKPGSEELHSLVIESLEDDVAMDIVSIPLAGKSSEADFMVIASGRSSRHVASIADKLMDRLKQNAGIIARIEGKGTADWALIDAGDVIVHIFRPEVRDFYQLEKMWQPAPDQAARASAL